MAVEYRLTLAGNIPADQVAECAIPDPAERPRPTDFDGVLSVRLYDRYGFALSVVSGRDGYYEAQDDAARWQWELETYVDLDFRMDKEDPTTTGTLNMVTVVARVLQCRDEDAALTLNDDLLLLTRVGGVIRKHNRSLWWDRYGFADEAVAG